MSDGMTVKAPVAGVTLPGQSVGAQAPAQPQTAQQAAPVEQPRSKPAQEPADIEAVAQQLDSYLKRVSRSLEFHLDNESGRMVCCVRDSQTGDLIRQIPNEEVLRMAELAHDETIVLLSERA
jgi:flagellar protein FlaG